MQAVVIKRTIPLIACVLLLVPATAQTTPTDNTKQPQPSVPRAQERQHVPQPDRSSSTAGNPGTRSDTLGTALYYPDTALANILLDHSQAQRVADLDVRYAERLQELGSTDAADPAYQKVWAARRDDLRLIFTPVQFKQW